MIQRADQKAISLLSILGVFMVFFVAYYRVMPVNVVTAVLISFYFVFALLSIVNLIMAIRPRVREHLYETESQTTLPRSDPAFFAGICSFPNVAAYKESLQQIMGDESAISEIFIRQIYTVAQINTIKFKYVQRGVVFVITSLAIELAVIVYLFLYHIGDARLPSIF